MKVAIMQPYFFPYIGYFQLISAVDVFVIYDNIKYTKKGWINRNRFLRNGTDVVFTVPLQKDSDSLDVRDRKVARDFDRDRLLNQLREAYRGAPYYGAAFPIVETAVMSMRENLFEYIYGSVIEICRYLAVGTRIVRSSSFDIESGLKAEQKVLALCRAARATVYVNAIGGRDLYSSEAFRAGGIELQFLKSRSIAYRQFGDPFVPWLSIIDVMMFNSVPAIRELLDHGYEFV